MQSVFPIAYFGSISYFKKLVDSGNIAFEVFETFPRHSFRNHCSILCPNGILDLTVPVLKPSGSRTMTKDILIDYSMDWQKKHWKSIVSSYASSPYFDHYGMEIEAILSKKHFSLIDLNRETHEKISAWLDLNLPFTETKDYLKGYEQDFRNFFKNREESGEYSYQQVFNSKDNFIPDLSILDAIMNLGPMARKLLIA